MMTRIKKRCKTLGCPNLHSNPSGYCDECTARFRAKHPHHDAPDRPTAVERGYDYKWRVFASRYLRMHPVCAMCGAPAKCVDHKTATADMMMDAYGHFDLDPDNYQPLCIRCNNIKGLTTDRAMRAQYQHDKETFNV